MKPEINAATEFLSRIFLARDNIAKEKVVEFKQQLSELLEERFRNHWHEHCPTKGQAYRCIRVCPEEPLDPILEKVCAGVGISVGDFNLPFELTLWVDPTEVVCKFGDLKCSYHIVAKKDNTSGNLNSQTDKLDIEDLVENARDLYLKKQTIIIHPIHSTEMHISNPFSDGSSHCITMAIRINGTMHYQMSSSPPPVYDGSPQFKGKHSHSAHKHGGFHYYGKSSGGKGTYLANSTTNVSGSFISSIHHGYQHHHNQQHYYNNINDSSFGYSNGYLNGYGGDENGYVFDQQSSSPPKANGSMSVPSLSGVSGSGALFQSSPTPEQIQQQLQHPPPIPSSISHPQQAFSHPSPNVTALPPQHPPPPPSSNSNSSSSAVGAGKANSNGSSSKHHDTRGNLKQKGKQTSPAKEMK